MMTTFKVSIVAVESSATHIYSILFYSILFSAEPLAFVLFCTELIDAIPGLQAHIKKHGEECAEKARHESAGRLEFTMTDKQQLHKINVNQLGKYLLLFLFLNCTQVHMICFFAGCSVVKIGKRFGVCC